MKKLEIRPGRSASAIGVIMGVMGMLFALFWIGMLLHLSRDDGIEPGVVLLLIFGAMLFVAMAAITWFYARSTFAQQRPSIMEIEEQAVPQASGENRAATGAAPDGSIGFCPYCGKPLKSDFLYCQYCGKKIMR